MASRSTVRISPAKFPEDKEAVSQLFTAYARSLEIDLTFQSFEHELASLPGKYHPENGGVLFIARAHPSSPHPNEETDRIIGCVALRAFKPPDICELKRLYITPDSRGLGAGRLLLAKAIETARQLGYSEMLLDTLPSMVAARKMYANVGFEEVEAYYESPIEGTSFMRLRLTKGDTS